MNVTDIDYKRKYLNEISDHWNQWYGKIGRFVLNWFLSGIVIELLIQLYCFAFSTDAEPLIYDQFTDALHKKYYFFWMASVLIYPILRQRYISRQIEKLRLLAELQNFRENLLFNSNKFSTVVAGRSFYSSLNPLNKFTLHDELSLTNDLLTAILQHYCKLNQLNAHDTYTEITELTKK